MSLKPVCYKCHRFFKPYKNGLYFTEGMPRYSDAKPGTADPGSWMPYKLWCGDVWKCEGCDTLIIVGTGHQPIATQHQAEFHERRAQLEATYQVNDC